MNLSLKHLLCQPHYLFLVLEEWWKFSPFSYVVNGFSQRNAICMHLII